MTKKTAPGPHDQQGGGGGEGEGGKPTQRGGGRSGRGCEKNGVKGGAGSSRGQAQEGNVWTRKTGVQKKQGSIKLEQEKKGEPAQKKTRPKKKIVHTPGGGHGPHGGGGKAVYVFRVWVLGGEG